MAKRFIDTDIFKKSFIRGLDAPHKLLFLYLINDCNHAGIWECDWEVACIRLGVEVNEKTARDNFGDKVVIFDGGSKLFIPSFIDFQYGELNPDNRAHKSVIDILDRYKLLKKNKPLNKPLTTPLQGRKDMDKDKDKDMDKDILSRENEFLEEVKTFKDVYSADMLNAFFAYWSEKNEKKGKMRFEMQETWDTKKRLYTWKNRS